MPDTMRFIQANLARIPGAQLSFLNDGTIKDFSLLLVKEPNIIDVDGKPIVHQHNHWPAVHPTLIREADRLAWKENRCTTGSAIAGRYSCHIFRDAQNARNPGKVVYTHHKGRVAIDNSFIKNSQPSKGWHRKWCW
jgi:hypothetical protein